MRIGIISDIHNNLPALEAVLTQLGPCDRVICCGDIIGIGPNPEQTVQRLKQIPGLTAVRGNHERYLLESMPEQISHTGEKEMSSEEERHHQWEHSQLSLDSITFLHGLEYREKLELEGKTIAVQHYAMDYDNVYVNFTAEPSGEAMAALFEGVEADVVVYGHAHNPHVCQYEGKWFINPGALGCPGQEKNLARAGVLTIEEGAVTYELVEVRYDVAQVLAEIDRLQYPDAETIKKIFYDVDK